MMVKGKTSLFIDDFEKANDRLLARVADMCKLVGFAFSQRLQVLLWNNERGT